MKSILSNAPTPEHKLIDQAHECISHLEEIEARMNSYIGVVPEPAEGTVGGKPAPDESTILGRTYLLLGRLQRLCHNMERVNSTIMQM